MPSLHGTQQQLGMEEMLRLSLAIPVELEYLHSPLTWVILICLTTLFPEVYYGLQF